MSFRSTVARVVVLLLCAQGIALAAEKGKARGSLKASTPKQILLTPEELKWGDAPPVLLPGAQMAVLAGDPSVPDRLFTIRLKLPAGYKVMPHWHPADEHVTIISGEFQIGEGDTFSVEEARTLDPGSYFVMPARHHHFAATTKETIVQVHGVGPWKLIYVDPTDDPRNKPKAR